MTTPSLIEQFVHARSLAVAGASATRQRFGNTVYRELRRCYRVLAVHPSAKSIEGDPAYSSLGSLPEAVEGVIVVVPPDRAEQVVVDAATAGIERVWLQPGAESSAVVAVAAEHGLGVVVGQCVLMHRAADRFPHGLHRWFTRLFGRLDQ